ncbi:nucleolar protein 10 [Skeletonema marinoi]|uniref:Nucleolar protein 10 n=1 Tax=Skeletonema marinoi TaxID=267567 RepID=A0AAD8YKP9_9STRA|nr:nucleolar protein 10 [Skeletonema marinoi]
MLYNNRNSTRKRKSQRAPTLLVSHLMINSAVNELA